MDSSITALALAPAPAPAAPAKTQPQMTDSQLQKNASSYQEIPTDRKLADANHSLEQKPLDSRDTEPMDIPMQENSGPAQPLVLQAQQVGETTPVLINPDMDVTEAMEVMEISTCPVQQIEELERQYAARMGPPCSRPPSPPSLKKRKMEHTLTPHTADKETDKILMGYCQDDLAGHIPTDKLELLQDLLSSERSVLKPSLRHLISILDSPEDMRKIIKNNPNLATGTLANMDEVVFKAQSNILPLRINSTKGIAIAGESSSVLCDSSGLYLVHDYSDISFKKAEFPCMQMRAIFRRCDFSQANFFGSVLIDCDFRGSNFTKALMQKGAIQHCDFHGATLTDVDFGYTRCITYSDKDEKCFANTINLLFNAVIAYSRREENDRPAGTKALESLALMFTDRKQLKEARAVYDELLQRRDTRLSDFNNLGYAYLNAIGDLSEKDHENRAHLAEKAIDWLQTGWKTTINNEAGVINHYTLFSLAMRAMENTGPSYDWRKGLEEIESRDTIKNTHVLVGKAQLLAAKQADNEAMALLRQMVADPEHCRKKLPEICKIISEIGLRNKTLLAQALSLLEESIFSAVRNCARGPLYAQDKKKQINFCAPLLHKINLLLQSERSKEALKLIHLIRLEIPGVKEALLGEEYKNSFIWQNREDGFERLILQIRAALAAIGVTDID